MAEGSKSSPATVAAVDGPLLADRLGQWAAVRSDDVAYTFVDYATDPAGNARATSWGSLHRQVVGLAGRLGRLTAPGDRVAVLAPSGIEYLVAVLAAWQADLIAVPLFPPGLPQYDGRLAVTFDDCAPAAVVTVPGCAGPVGQFVSGRGRGVPVVVVDDSAAPDRPGEPAGALRQARAPRCRDDVAYLQYSSGSTRRPTGVEITHGNLTANVAQLVARMTGGRPRFTAVNWLPLFHDMGLLASLAVPLWHGTDSVLCDPVAFLMHPVRWLRLLHGRSDAYTCAPNFAYDYCARRVSDPDLAGLDLSGVFLWLNGAEPVRASTLRHFVQRLREAGTGLDERALSPAYGLAEATVFVSGDSLDAPPTIARVDRDRLADGRFVPLPESAGPARRAEDAAAGAVTELVSCGRPADQHVVIVDPESLLALPSGRVGEIWVHGRNVAGRYWQEPELSSRTFRARLAGCLPDGLPDRPWLRTGDLGVLHDGALYVTGRLKDLLIVAGRNVYPQDVEETVSGLGLGRAAAFTVTAADAERVVVVAECSRSAAPDGSPPAELLARVRGAVWRHHDLALHDVVLAEPGALPRTTSGKVSRTSCRAAYLSGALASRPGAEHPGAEPARR